MSKRRCEEVQYEVESIRNRRLDVLSGQYEYEIKWAGYSDLHNTWEALRNLQGMLDLVKEFDRKKEREDLKCDRPIEGRVTRSSPVERCQPKRNSKPKKSGAPSRAAPKLRAKENSRSRKIIKKPILKEPQPVWLTDKEILDRLRKFVTIIKSSNSGSSKKSLKDFDEQSPQPAAQEPSTTVGRGESDGKSQLVQDREVDLRRLADNKATIEDVRYANGRFTYKLVDPENREWQSIWVTREEFVRLRPQTLLNYYIRHL